MEDGDGGVGEEVPKLTEAEEEEMRKQKVLKEAAEEEERQKKEEKRQKKEEKFLHKLATNTTKKAGNIFTHLL